MPDYINPARKVIADGKRALSKITITAKCPGCSQEFTKSGAWFNRVKFKCPACGSKFDPQPFRDLAASAIKQAKAALERRK